jgi:hypothetical protein
LIIMAVMVLLIAVAVPSYQRVMAMGRRALCHNNLRRLGEAYATKNAASLNLASRYVGILGTSWPGAMLVYSNYSEKILLCPESEATFQMTKPRFGQSDWYNMSWDFFNFPPVWEGQDFVDFYESGSMPSMWKINDEDYEVWRANREIGWGVMDNNKDFLPKYTPGEDPKSYWILLEDSPDEWTSPSAGGVDYVDCDIHIVEKSPGVFEMTIYDYGNSVAKHWVTMSEDASDAPPHGEDGEDVRPGWVELPKDTEEGYGPFYYAGADTNYGMNAEKPHAGTQKILLLDYDEHMADPEAAPGTPEAFEDLVGARHLGRTSVLFASGGVETMAPNDFTPRQSAHYDRYWASSE